MTCPVLSTVSVLYEQLSGETTIVSDAEVSASTTVKRRWLLLDWQYRTYLPILMDTMPAKAPLAAKLRALPAIVDERSCRDAAVCLLEFLMDPVGLDTPEDRTCMGLSLFYTFDHVTGGISETALLSIATVGVKSLWSYMHDGGSRVDVLLESLRVLLSKLEATV